MTSARPQPMREPSPRRSSFTLRAQCAKTVVAAIVVTARGPNGLPHRPIDGEASSLQTLLTASRVVNRLARF